MRFRAVIFIVPLLLWAALARGAGEGKILAQAAPSATTTAIYVVPATTAGQQVSSVNIRTVWVTNVDTAAHAFRMAVAQACAADAIAQYIYYGVSLPANSSLVQSVNLPLSATDCVRVWSDADQKLVFSLFGMTSP